MTKDGRVTYSRRHSYATKSNVLKVIKTPGGKLVGHYANKKRNGPKCGDCKNPLPGIKCLSPFQYKNVHKRERTVSRAYGGSRCAKCVRQRIIRAFLIEEQKIVKQMMLEKAQGSKKK
uniref:60S ribosomal protein L34 n=1 Tax=Aureoumbra lagunensis TaxID=44058 RepID=A0A7S3K4R2_9STRA|mmetsp:Transcript_13800/g.18431  ORF Transcript_13800/g.18431 Transcript_13800/m.18431 type:complete len:118 (-) Transcript_13800:268-621(-)